MIIYGPLTGERFVARARAEGLTDIEGRVMDCHALDPPDDTFDLTASQFGVMLVPDQRRERRAECPEFRSGQEMWDWVYYGNPIPGVLVADLTEEQREMMRRVLDGMVRERIGTNGKAVLTNAVNIGIGVKP